MTFLDFARNHGIIINDYPPLGRWMRLATDDHPRKRNGAVKYLGNVGFVQNHATQTEVAVWRESQDSTPRIDPRLLAEQVKKANDRARERQQRAADKAEWILSQCELLPHPYLRAKGFENELANVWKPDDNKRLLVVPMRVGREIVGCQLIDEKGGKKFLAGQRTSEAAYVINTGGAPVLCEGFATGLSVRDALNALKARYALFVCFSASNLARLAKTLPRGLVVADNDISGTGQKVAHETGWPYFLPPVAGQDFNDFHKASSLFRASQALRAAMTKGAA